MREKYNLFNSIIFSIPSKMDRNKLKILLILTCVLGHYEVAAFECFKCISNEQDTCVEDPEKLPLASSRVECAGFCTIVRTEYTDIPGELVRLVRDCELKPIVENGVRTDKHYTKMYTSCNTDQCNSGDGKRAPGEGNDGRTGPKDVIIVFETASGWMNKPSYILFLVLGTISFYNVLHSIL